MAALVREMQRIAELWLSAYAYTVATGDVDAHLDMVSPQLRVVGVSRAGVLAYRDWAKRRRNDITKRRLLRITHRNLALGTCRPGRLHFTVAECLKSARGESYLLDKEVVLNLDPDGRWREVEEFVRHVRMLPAALPPTPHPPAAAPGESG